MSLNSSFPKDLISYPNLRSSSNQLTTKSMTLHSIPVRRNNRLELQLREWNE